MSDMVSTTDTCGPKEEGPCILCQSTVQGARFVVTREMDLGGDFVILGFDADEQRNWGNEGWPGCHWGSRCGDCVVKSNHAIDLDRLLGLSVAKDWMEGSLRPFGIRVSDEARDAVSEADATWYVRVK